MIAWSRYRSSQEELGSALLRFREESARLLVFQVHVRHRSHSPQRGLQKEPTILEIANCNAHALAPGSIPTRLNHGDSGSLNRAYNGETLLQCAQVKYGTTPEPLLSVSGVSLESKFCDETVHVQINLLMSTLDEHQSGFNVALERQRH